MHHRAGTQSARADPLSPVLQSEVLHGMLQRRLITDELSCARSSSARPTHPWLPRLLAANTATEPICSAFRAVATAWVLIVAKGYVFCRPVWSFR